MTLAEKQAHLIQTVNALGDCFDQYSYLIVRSNDLPAFPEEYRLDSNLVEGCQSKVWLHMQANPDGSFHMDADSDALILKGVLAIIAELVEGAPVAEVAALEWNILDQTELGATFTSARSVGMRQAFSTLSETAKQMMET